MAEEKGTAFSSEQRLKLTTAAIGVGGVMFTAIVGLLGPLSGWVNQRRELELEATKNANQQRLTEIQLAHTREMDFLDKLVNSEKIGSEIDKSYYRRDVLKFFATTFEDRNPLKGFAQAELKQAQERVDVVEQLRAERREALEKAAKALEELEKLKLELAERGEAAAKATAPAVAKAEGAIARLSLASTRINALETNGTPSPAQSPVQGPPPSSPRGDGVLQESPPKPKPSSCSCSPGDLQCAMRCAAKG